MYGAVFASPPPPHPGLDNPQGLPLPLPGTTMAQGSGMYSEALKSKDKMKQPAFAHGRLALAVCHNVYLPRCRLFITVFRFFSSTVACPGSCGSTTQTAGPSQNFHATPTNRFFEKNLTVLHHFLPGPST